jgi:hypothetical protein
MSKEKRERMVITSKDLPDDVYEILNERASKRALTAYIIEIVRENAKTKLILEKLDNIDRKINNISLKNVTMKSDNTAENKEDEKITEGTILSVDKIEGSIDEDDKTDFDF